MSENNKTMKSRNIYDDNIKDVKTIQDVEGLKINGNFNVLSKNEDTIFFEFGNDFWKLDKKNRKLHQYNDYRSMEMDYGDKVFDELTPTSNKDYGAVLFNSLYNSERLKDLPDFSLTERKEYVVEPGKAVKNSIRIPAKELLQKNRNVANKFDDITSNIQSEETKPIMDMIKSTIQLMALNYFFFKKQMENKKKEDFLRKIIDGLDKNLIDVNKLMSDRNLMQQLPELDDVIKRYLQQSLSNDEMASEISKVLDSENAQRIAEEMTKKDGFLKEIEEKVFNKIDVTIEENEMTLFKNKLEIDGNNGFKFAQEMLVSNQKKIFEKNPEISVQDYTIATLFMANKIDKTMNAPEQENVSKRLLLEEVGEYFLGKDKEQVDIKNLNLNNVSFIIKEMVKATIQDIKMDMSKKAGISQKM